MPSISDLILLAQVLDQIIVACQQQSRHPTPAEVAELARVAQLCKLADVTLDNALARYH